MKRNSIPGRMPTNEKDKYLQTFLQLIRTGLDMETCPKIPQLEPQDWLIVVDMARKQSVDGILIDGINKLGKGANIPYSMMMNEIGSLFAIEKSNKKMNQMVETVKEYFRNHKFHPILLKGQGIARLYPNPLHRIPGDIDMWLTDEDKSIRRYVKSIFPDSKITYHHVDFPMWEEVLVEAHTTPSWMYNPFSNARLQSFLESFARNNPEADLPSNEMNRVYLLVHSYRHFMDDGIGFRQLIDYMMLLRQGFTEEERIRTMQVMKSIHLDKFCGAMMYTLQELFGLEKEYQLTSPLVSEGELLIEEVMQAGDLGRYDRSFHGNRDTESTIARFIRRTRRSLRFIGSYPEEICWAPLFKIWHWIWRKSVN